MYKNSDNHQNNEICFEAGIVRLRHQEKIITKG